MRCALVHDWYYTNGGAEKVVRSINHIYPEIENYALIDFLGDKDREEILNKKRVQVSFIQKLPTAKSNHRKFIQLFPYAMEQFDLREYDLVLSSSSSVAKGVLTNQQQLHICYCHSPMRYAWDLYHQYLHESNLVSGPKSLYARYLLHKLRQWDVLSSNRVDYFIANSHFISKRIKKLYRRESHVIYPPVDVEKFNFQRQKEDFYFTASRMVPYKKIDTIVSAFNEMPDKKLFVAGDGPDYKKISKIAKENIVMLGRVSDEEMHKYLSSAKAFVFAALEDFGILPVEAQCCGTPVIGYGEGGLRETVVNKKTGLFFYEQKSKSIIDAVRNFEGLTFDSEAIRGHALKFSAFRFEEEVRDFISEKYQKFKPNGKTHTD